MSVQGTPEWRQERCGRATASRFKDVLAKIKTGEAAVRRTYRTELVTERLTGNPLDGYHNAAMQWGNDHEAEARDAFQDSTGLWVVRVGFVAHPELMVGCSPDGLIEPDTGIEIKCPFNSAVHVETLMWGMPPEHKAQIQGSMWLTDRARWWFASYDPRMPPKLRLYKQLVERDEEYIAALANEVGVFLREVDALTAKLLTEAQ